MSEREKFGVAGFLYNPATRSVLLHHRDGNTTYNPHKWAFFGGLGEGTETPLEGFVRELREETGLHVRPEDVTPLCAYLNEEFGVMRHVFFVRSSVGTSELTLGEGAGFAWVSLSGLDAYDLTAKTVRDLQYFMKEYASLIQSRDGHFCT